MERAAAPTGRGKANGVAPFVQSLANMVNNPDCPCIKWSEDGKKFIIENVDEFCQHVLPLFFCHKSMPSFARQLNYHDFYKCMDGEENASLRATAGSGKKRKRSERPTRLVYAHPFFIKDNPQLLPNITRRTNRKASVALAAQRQAKEQTLMTEQNGSHNATRALKAAREAEHSSKSNEKPKTTSNSRQVKKKRNKDSQQRHEVVNNANRDRESVDYRTNFSYQMERVPRDENYAWQGSFSNRMSTYQPPAYYQNSYPTLQSQPSYGDETRTPFSMSEYPPGINSLYTQRSFSINSGTHPMETQTKAETAVDQENNIPSLGSDVASNAHTEAARMNSIPFDGNFQFTTEFSFPPSLHHAESFMPQDDTYYNLSEVNANPSMASREESQFGPTQQQLEENAVTKQVSITADAPLDGTPKSARPTDSDLSRGENRNVDNSAELEAAFMLRGMSWHYETSDRPANQVQNT